MRYIIHKHTYMGYIYIITSYLYLNRSIHLYSCNYLHLYPPVILSHSIYLIQKVHLHFGSVNILILENLRICIQLYGYLKILKSQRVKICLISYRSISK